MQRKSRLQDALEKSDTMLAALIGPMHPVRIEIKKLMDEIAAREANAAT